MADHIVNNVAGPFFDIQAAVTAAASGDNVYIQETGVTYSGANNRGISLAGFSGIGWDAPGLNIEGVAAGGQYPLIDNDQGADIAVFDVNSGDYISITKLRFAASAAGNARAVKTHAATGHLYCGLLHITPLFDGYCAIEITDNPGTCYADIHIECCDFDGTIRAGTAHIIVSRGAPNITVNNCLFENRPYQIRVFASLLATDVWRFENCTFIGAQYVHFFFSNVASNGTLDILDCIFKDQTGGAPWAAIFCNNVPGAGFTLDYCDFHNNTNDTFNCVKGPNCIAADPLWVGGGATTWIDFITHVTSRLPQEATVLTGAQDGLCQGGWLPAGEDVPCIEGNGDLCCECGG